jgi:hypothetical protein
LLLDHRPLRRLLVRGPTTQRLITQAPHFGDHPSLCFVGLRYVCLGIFHNRQ